MEDLIEQFKMYRASHPNLSQCWIAYLELKKRHYDEIVMHQCGIVLELLKNNCADWTPADIVSVLFFKRSV